MTNQRLIQPGLMVNALAQVHPTAALLHHQLVVLVILEHVQHAHNVWMVEILQQVHLNRHHPIRSLRAGHPTLGQNLLLANELGDGQQAAVFARRQLHRPKGAVADQLEGVVVLGVLATDGLVVFIFQRAQRDFLHFQLGRVQEEVVADDAASGGAGNEVDGRVGVAVPEASTPDGEAGDGTAGHGVCKIDKLLISHFKFNLIIFIDLIDFY